MKLPLLSTLFLAMASAASAADFPSTVVLKIGAPATSSLGVVGRIIAGHLGKHLPGQATVEAEPVEGAHGVQLARQLAETEPRDGSVAGMFLLSVMQRYVTDPKDYDFSPAELQWVGSLASHVGLCVKDADSGARLTDPDLTFGATTKGSNFYAMAAIVRETKNQDADIVVGFRSDAELAAALDRGEIDAYCGISYSTYEREGRAATQTILGGFGNAEKLSELGIEDLSASITGLDRQVVELATTVHKYFYAVTLPAGTDAETVAAHREAFAAMNQDPAFLDEIKANVTEYAPSTGEEVQAGMRRLLATDPAVVARFAEILK